jgi:8-oxo-dGTP pyrophosphatase MutT (NUDIX family)
MKTFISTETNPILRASILEPSPISEPVKHDPIRAYNNGAVTVEQVSSKFGPFNTVKIGETNKAVAVLIYKDGEFLLALQPRYAVGVLAWETPRGTVEEDENFITAAVREVWEETGISIPSERLKSLGTIHADSGILSVKTEAYFANLCGMDIEQQSVGLKADEVQFFNQHDVEVALAQGFIYDSFTATAFLRAKTRKLF